MFLPVTQSMPQMAEEMLPTPLLLRTLTAFSRAGGDPDDAEAVVLGGHRTGACVPWPSPSDQFPVFLPEQSTPPVTLMS